MVYEFIGKCLLVKTEGKKILVIGDLHLGYEEFLNRAGVFVSRAMLNEILDYLRAILKRTGKVEEVVFLGDVKHVFGRILNQEWTDFLKIADCLKEMCEKITIVRGNHDVVLDAVAEKNEVELKNFYAVGKYCFLHGDREFKDIYEKKIKCWVVGHGHPAVKISDGTTVEKYKCFLVGKFRGKNIIIVPSFFFYREGTDPRESDLGLAWKINYRNFRAFVVGDDLEVFDFGFVSKII